MRKLYALSDKIDSGRELFLIGVLTEIKPGTKTEKGEYMFEYKLGGTFPKASFMIRDFPNPAKVYTGTETERFINRFVPPRDCEDIDEILKTYNMPEFDEWKFLRIVSRRGKHFNGCHLYDFLPETAGVYEKL